MRIDRVLWKLPFRSPPPACSSSLYRDDSDEDTPLLLESRSCCHSPTPSFFVPRESSPPLHPPYLSPISDISPTSCHTHHNHNKDCSLPLSSPTHYSSSSISSLYMQDHHTGNTMVEGTNQDVLYPISPQGGIQSSSFSSSSSPQSLLSERPSLYLSQSSLKQSSFCYRSSTACAYTSTALSSSTASSSSTTTTTTTTSTTISSTTPSSHTPACVSVNDCHNVHSNCTLTCSVSSLHSSSVPLSIPASAINPETTSLSDANEFSFLSNCITFFPRITPRFK